MLFPQNMLIQKSEMGMSYNEKTSVRNDATQGGAEAKCDKFTSALTDETIRKHFSIMLCSATSTKELVRYTIQ